MKTRGRLSAIVVLRLAPVKRTVRRRPRTFAAAAVLVAVVALTAGGGLVLVSTAPPAVSTTTNTAPAFTVRDGWTLADLERHVEAGDVDAITAAPASAGNPGGQLLARTRSGQVVTIDPEERVLIHPTDAEA
jgi:predicted PurR-regulated permease PerM